MRRPLLILTVIVVAGCRPQPDSDRLAAAYADLLLYRQRSVRLDTTAVRAGIDSILAAHRMTADEYARAFSALADDHRALPLFFSNVEARLAEADSARR